MPRTTEDRRDEERLKNLETAPYHVKVLSDWIVEELNRIEQTPVEEGGLLVKGHPEQKKQNVATKAIPALHAQMIRKSPPGTDIPTQDAIRAWRVAKIKEIPTRYLPAIAAYRELGETPEMIRLWLMGQIEGGKGEIPPITPDQIYACGYDQLLWVIKTAATRLAEASIEKDQKCADPKKTASRAKVKK